MDRPGLSQAFSFDFSFGKIPRFSPAGKKTAFPQGFSRRKRLALNPEPHPSQGRIIPGLTTGPSLEKKKWLV